MSLNLRSLLMYRLKHKILNTTSYYYLTQMDIFLLIRFGLAQFFIYKEMPNLGSLELAVLKRLSLCHRRTHIQHHMKRVSTAALASVCVRMCFCLFTILAL